MLIAIRGLDLVCLKHELLRTGLVNFDSLVMMCMYEHIVVGTILLARGVSCR